MAHFGVWIAREPMVSLLVGLALVTTIGGCDSPERLPVLPPLPTPALVAVLQTPLAQPTPSAPTGAAWTPSPRAAQPTLSPTTRVPTETPTVRLPVALTGEEALRSGEFDARLVYDDGTLLTAELRFDLGGRDRAPRLHLVSTYDGPEGEQRVEQITVGGGSWRREADGEWALSPDKTSVVDQVRAFLPPPAEAGKAAGVPSASGRALFLGQDPLRPRETVLSVDPLTGVPQQLVEFRRGDGSVRTVLYRRWNTPVEIESPALP